jgi:molybdopterin-guanine dinucleotide biosynthesis protein A
MVVDNWKLRGPLAGLLSTFSEMTSPFVFAVAGDAPFVEARFIDELAQHWQEGDEAVVPVHSVDGHEQLEPLAAIYERRAFMREGFDVLAGSRGALRRVIERMAARKVTIGDARIFTNVNTPADYERLRSALRA